MPSKPAAKKPAAKAPAKPATKPSAKPAAKAEPAPKVAAKPATSPKAAPGKSLPKPTALSSMAAPAKGDEVVPPGPKLEKLADGTLCQIEILKDGHFFIARTQTDTGLAKEFKNTVFEDLLTEMLITLQEQLID